MKDLQGLTLIEWMIAVAIIGILTAVAIPAYRNYANRTAFSELILAISSRKSAVEVAIQTRNPANLAALDGGSLGLPADVSATPDSHGMAIADGTITMTWKTDGSALAGSTYTLTAADVVPPVQWTEGGTCIANGFC